jgi:peptidoglycan/xylan/chitin deacetylase (PgdA/CDA1 family)
VNRTTLQRAIAAVSVCSMAVLPLVAAQPAAAVATPRVSVASTGVDAPGGSVMVVVTVANVPAGWTATMYAGVGAWPRSCEPFTWRHGPGGTTVSQKCYANLPTKAGSWTLRGTATLTKAKSAPRAYWGSKVIKTEGPATLPVSAAVRKQVTNCSNTTKNVQLTFDDGFTSASNLNSILATLKANNVRARFFVIGSWARANPSMMKQIRAGGHYVANHTSTHPKLHSISDASVRSQIAGGVVATTNAKLLRPPTGAGAYTARLYWLARAAGYRVCYWGSDTRDWSGISASGIVTKVVRGDSETSPVRAGEVVLLHLSNTQSRYALPTMIKSLRAKGLTFDKLR